MKSQEVRLANFNNCFVLEEGVVILYHYPSLRLSNWPGQKPVSIIFKITLKQIRIISIALVNEKNLILIHQF